METQTVRNIETEKYDLGHPSLIKRGYVRREFSENRGVIEAILKTESILDKFKVNWVAYQEGFCQIDLFDVDSGRRKLTEIRRNLNSWLEENFDSSVYMAGAVALYVNPNTNSRIHRAVLDIGSLDEVRESTKIGHCRKKNKKLFVIGCEYSTIRDNRGQD
jgi:hypothetical protein